MYNVYVYLLTLCVLIFAENLLTRLRRLFYVVKNNKFINFIFKNKNHKVVENWIKNLTVGNLIAVEVLVIFSSCDTRFRIKHILAEYRKYKVQRTKIDTPNRLHAF